LFKERKPNKQKKRKKKKKAVGVSLLDPSLELDQDTKQHLLGISGYRWAEYNTKCLTSTRATPSRRSNQVHNQAPGNVTTTTTATTSAGNHSAAGIHQDENEYDWLEYSSSSNNSDRDLIASYELDDSLNEEYQPEQAAQHHLEHLIQLNHDREAAMSRPPVDDRAVVECEIGAGQCPNILLLSNELLLLIFNNLNSYDLLSVRRTCRLFAMLATLAPAWFDFVHERDLHGTTPLHVACFTGNLDGVAYLLERGADPAAIDITGVSPIDIARRLGHDSIAWLLAQHTLHHKASSLSFRRR